MRSMRHFVLLAIVAISFVLCGTAQAADVPAAKIGVVDVQQLAAESEPALAAKKEMEDKYGKERKDIEEQGKKLQKMAADLKKNPKSSKEKQEAFMKAKRDLDQKAASVMRKAEHDQAKHYQSMITLVYNAAYEVAKAKGFNFVVSTQSVLYADKSMDITQDVMDELNKQFRAQQKDGGDKKDEKK